MVIADFIFFPISVGFFCCVVVKKFFVSAYIFEFSLTTLRSIVYLNFIVEFVVDSLSMLLRYREEFFAVLFISCFGIYRNVIEIKNFKFMLIDIIAFNLKIYFPFIDLFMRLFRLFKI